MSDNIEWHPSPESMAAVREYCERMAVKIRDSDRGLVVVSDEADNAGLCDSPRVDLVDLVAWLKANRPELLR